MGTSQQFHVEAVRGRDLKYLGTDQSELNALMDRGVDLLWILCEAYNVLADAVQDGASF